MNPRNGRQQVTPPSCEQQAYNTEAVPREDYHDRIRKSLTIPICILPQCRWQRYHLVLPPLRSNTHLPNPHIQSGASDRRPCGSYQCSWSADPCSCTIRTFCGIRRTYHERTSGAMWHSISRHTNALPASVHHAGWRRIWNICTRHTPLTDRCWSRSSGKPICGCTQRHIFRWPKCT